MYAIVIAQQTLNMRPCKNFHFPTQICCCDSLRIVATSGNDRFIRIWDTENHLIKELSFDDDVEAICFANDRGDLLVALQGKFKFQSFSFLLNLFSYCL